MRLDIPGWEITVACQDTIASAGVGREMFAANTDPILELVGDVARADVNGPLDAHGELGERALSSAARRRPTCVQSGNQ